MRILVTGSEGFIGKHLVRRLRGEGHKVHEWDTKPDSYGDLFYQSAHWQPTFDVIYHLACVNQQKAEFVPNENLDTNALGARTMARMAEEHGAKLVYTSTASVYGNNAFIPTAVNDPRDPLTDYAVAKLAGEHYVRNHCSNYSILRLSNVYGPGQTTDNPYCGVIGQFFDAAMAGKPLKIYGDGRQTRDYTYIDDVIEVLHDEICNLNQNQTLNVSHGDETPVIELAEWFNREFGVETEHVAPRSVDGITRRCLLSDFDCPTTLNVGLHKTLEWFKLLKPLEDSKFTGWLA